MDAELVQSLFRSIWVIRSEVQGVVDFKASTIVGNVHLTESMYFEELDFTGAHVVGDIYCQDSQMHGKFNGLGAIIEGQVNFNRADCLCTPESICIDGSRIGGELFLEKLKARGAFHAPLLRVGQDIHACGAQLGGIMLYEGKPFSLSLVAVSVQGMIDFSGATFAAAVSLREAQVQGMIIFKKAQFIGRENVLNLDGAVIGGDLVFEGLVTCGSIEMTYGSIKGEVSFINAALKEAAFREVSFGKTFFWCQLSRPTNLNLDSSTLQNLKDDQGSWPVSGGLRLAGATYNTLELASAVGKPESAVNKSETVRLRILWLERQSYKQVILPQPWQQLASVLEASGDRAGAKHVLFAYSRMQAQRGGWVTRPASWVFDKIVEEPLRISIPISIFWGMGAVVFWRAQRMRKMAPTEHTALERFNAGESIDNYPRFHPIAYALENVLPVVKLGQDAAWAPNPTLATPVSRPGWRRFAPSVEYRWLVRLRWTLIIAGWVMALILAGAIGSRFK